METKRILHATEAAALNCVLMAEAVHRLQEAAQFLENLESTEAIECHEELVYYAKKAREDYLPVAAALAGFVSKYSRLLREKTQDNNARIHSAARYADIDADHALTALENSEKFVKGQRPQ